MYLLIGAYSPDEYHPTYSVIPSPSATSGFGSLHAVVNLNSVNLRTLSGGQSSARYKSASNMQHVITIASSVTKVRWRPPAHSRQGDQGEVKETDRHDSMFAVATARLTSAGGSGVISLWSTNRPYMPLSVVEGHVEGGVAGFVWIKTPGPGKLNVFENSKEPQAITNESSKARKAASSPNTGEVTSRVGGRGDVESVIVGGP
jgi:hypothetical protein